jgi:hypothetical protein
MTATLHPNSAALASTRALNVSDGSNSGRGSPSTALPGSPLR